MTTYFDDLANLPAPSDFELEALDRRIPVIPATRCGFNCYVKLRNINASRPHFHAFLVEMGRANDVLTMWQWDTLLELFDARNERDTQNDALGRGR